MGAMHFLLTYLSFIRLNTTVQRNLIIIENTEARRKEKAKVRRRGEGREGQGVVGLREQEGRGRQGIVVWERGRKPQEIVCLKAGREMIEGSESRERVSRYWGPKRAKRGRRKRERRGKTQ